jgi:multicomponent Na+:H+ antiporter subunit D
VSPLPALPVVIPLLAAAAIAACSKFLPRRAADALAFAASVATTVLSFVLLAEASDHRIVYWFAGWRPHHGIAIGIDFSIDMMTAGAAILASVIVTTAFAFSWRYFDDTIGHRFDILLLVFLAAMVGFVSAGDLFDMFVFLELLSVCAYALAGERIEEAGPLQGAFNFAIVTSLGTFTILLGIAMLYARTGALNLAQMGVFLSGHHLDGLVVIAFTLLVVGLFTKAGVVPFHFWLGDSYAVIPAPVGILFVGVVTELGLFGLIRIWWPAFAGAFSSHGSAVGNVLIGVGVVTAIVGAVMAFLQQHLKRLLAFSVVAHVGLSLVGIGLFTHVALGGVAVWVAGHGLIAGALFLCTGILAFRLGSIDEEALRGRGRRLPGTATMFVLGALGLTALPPFGTFLGKALIEDAGTAAGYHWMPWVFGGVAALLGAALLRAAGRIFLGLGPDERDRFASDVIGEQAREEIREPSDHTPAVLWIPTAVLLVAGLAIGLAPGLAGHAERAAATFEDRRGYTADVLTGAGSPLPNVPVQDPSGQAVAYSLVSAVVAMGIAVLALFRRRLVPARVRRRLTSAISPLFRRVRLLHSGHVGDYAAWFAVGLAVLAGCFVLATR